MILGRLDYLSPPAPTSPADLRYLVDVLGGEEVFAIEDGESAWRWSAWARLRRSCSPTTSRATDRSTSTRWTTSRPRRPTAGRGWRRERAVELPLGPAATFRTPGGLGSPSTSHRGRSCRVMFRGGATSAERPAIGDLRTGSAGDETGTMASQTESRCTR